MTKEEKKLKLIALLNSDPTLDLKLYVQELDTPISILRKWKKQYLKDQSTDNLLKLVDAPAAIVERVFEEVEVEIIEASSDKPNSIGKIKEFKNVITELSLLQSETVATAKDIVTAISARVDTLAAAEGSHVTREIAELTQALSNIHSAFFNRPVTNIQVNQLSANGEGGLAALRERLKA